MSEENGGPAFPRSDSMNNYGDEGMSLLDWFAGVATDKDVEEMLGLSAENPMNRAEARWCHAKAMLAERNKHQEG